jgi:hypothetical protein
LNSLSHGLKPEFSRILQKAKCHSEELKEIALAEHMTTVEELRKGASLLQNQVNPIYRAIDVLPSRARISRW